MRKKTLFIVLLMCYAMSGIAQSLTLVEEFKILENSSAVVMYHNQFGDYEKPQMDDTFPYAVVRVLLEGNAHEVTAAKKMLGIYTGVLSEGLKASYLDFENEILFLVPKNSGHVELSCGDGCARQTILELPKLQSNAVYRGKVHYTPMVEPTPTAKEEAIKRQFFKFRLTPADAQVDVKENGEVITWRVKEGIASKAIDYGTYSYVISAHRYHSEQGTFTLSDTQTEKTIVLRPKFGWINIPATKEVKGASAYATNKTTGVRISLGTIPIVDKELDSGEYTILIQQDKYKDYTTDVLISDDNTTTLQPHLEVNYIRVTLVATQGADIILNGQRIGNSSWTGDLEYGEYSVQTDLENHQSAYTRLIVSKSSVDPIVLNQPIPIYGSLFVDGSPVDASVYVDDKFVGKSPYIANDLLIGSHKVRVEKSGYESYVQQIHIQENKESSLNYTLSNSAQVTIQVRNDSLANIYIRPLFGNGVERLLGRSVWSGSLAIGEYSVRTTRNGYRDSYMTIVVTSAQPTYLLTPPSKKQGGLYITSDPTSSSVYINGAYKGGTPYSAKLSPGTYTAYVARSGYEDSKTQTFTIVDGRDEKLDFSLKKIRKKIEMTSNFGPYHLLEMQYGYGLNVKSRGFTDHYVGLTYGYSPCRFGLSTSVNYGIFTQDIGISAGPTIRLTDMYSECNLQLMLGGGMVIRPTHSRNPLTWTVDAGLRFSFEEDSDFAWYSFALGARYYDYTIIPTASVSLFPARLLYLAAIEEEDFPCVYTDVTSGYVFSSEEWLIGGQISYIPSHLGVGASFMYGFDGGWDVTAGPVFRLTPDYINLDLQIYQGFGYGSYSDDAFIAETILRFGFGKRSRWGLWSIDIGCLYGPDDIGVTFGVSLPLIGVIATCGLAALFL